uniref:Uncharacterized protein n=1 Tax=Anguilla anguilla TaxID=7936 RepID=A0A0E9Q2A0_ANGAN
MEFSAVWCFIRHRFTCCSENVGQYSPIQSLLQCKYNVQCKLLWIGSSAK